MNTIKKILSGEKVRAHLPYIWLGAGILILIILTLSYIVRFTRGTNEMAPTAKNQSTQEPIRRGIYEWRDFRYLPKDTYGDDLVLAHEHGLNTVFISLNNYLDLYEDMKPGRDEELADFETQLEQFVRLARDNGFQVEALAGDMTWSDPELYYMSETILQFVTAYNSNRQRPAELRLSGVQFDVEPYNLPSFKKQKEKYLLHYVEYVAHMYDYRQSHQQDPATEVPMGFAVPFWYEGSEEGGTKITFSDKFDYPIYHILDIANQHHGYLVLMAYRNELEGKDGVFAHVEAEFDYAVQRAKNARILIGQEISEVKPEKLTYANKDLGDFLENLRLIDNQFKNNPVFGGITINDFEALSKKF